MKLKKTASVLVVIMVIGGIFLRPTNNTSYADYNPNVKVIEVNGTDDDIDLNYGGVTIVKDGDTTFEITHTGRTLTDKQGRSSRLTISNANGSRDFVVVYGESVKDTFSITTIHNTKVAVKTKATVTYKPDSPTTLKTSVKLDSVTPGAGFSITSKSSKNGSSVDIGGTSTGTTTVDVGPVSSGFTKRLTGSFKAKLTGRTIGSAQGAPRFYVSLSWGHSYK
ncbi:MAG: hypothetical protein ACLVKT_15160 [Intestinibacter bartlettii]|jgi:hypothetical protein|uniref:hypothetical protein n=1 Tax=Intestinibacter bartlettii TaxID=261299 RepID=UPI00399ACA5C